MAMKLLIAFLLAASLMAGGPGEYPSQMVGHEIILSVQVKPDVPRPCGYWVDCDTTWRRRP